MRQPNAYSVKQVRGERPQEEVVDAIEERREGRGRQGTDRVRTTLPIDVERPLRAHDQGLSLK